MDILNLPGLAGWPGLIVTIITIVAYGYWTNKNVKNKVENASKAAQEKAQDIAKNALNSAIDAVQLESQALRRQIEDVEKREHRLDETLKTICAALEMKGIYITILGHMVSIREGKETTTTYIKEGDTNP